jgi:hypothetical protein
LPRCPEDAQAAEGRTWADAWSKRGSQEAFRVAEAGHAKLARTRAPDGGRWSVRTMARQTGLSKSSVQRLWAAHQLQPQRVRAFRFSKDLQFEEKVWDVVGLYLDPPDRALVLCCDYRHGTVTLFAALEYLSGKVFAHTASRHRHQEWLTFLRKIDKEIAPELELQIICDNDIFRFLDHRNLHMACAPLLNKEVASNAKFAVAQRKM